MCTQRIFRSEATLRAFWIAEDSKFLHVGNEDWSDCAEAQTDLSFHCVHKSEGTFSHVGAHFIKRTL